jgi:acetyltransferase-like isoleucine patch superfamily enzyme
VNHHLASFFGEFNCSAAAQRKTKTFLKRCALKLLSLDLLTHPLILKIYKLLNCMVFLCMEILSFSKKILWVSPLFRSVCKQVGTSLRIDCMPYISGKGNLVLGNRVRLSGKIDILFAGSDQPTLSIGDNTFIGHGCIFALRTGIAVGRDCLIAGGTYMADNDGHPLNDERRARGEGPDLNQIRPIVIGNRVWIGRGVTLLKGVQIGDGAVIGAGSVVRRNVQPYEIVAGSSKRCIDLAPQAVATSTHPQ